MGEATPNATRRIQSEIEDARAHMAYALFELEERLRPQRVMADAKEAIRASVRGQVQDVVDRTKRTASDVAEQARQTASGVMVQARQAASGITEQTRYAATRMIDHARANPMQTALLSSAGLLLMLRPLRHRLNGSAVARRAGPLGLGVSALTTAAILYAAWQSGHVSDTRRPVEIR